ncbi:DUF2075 domain-containing protein [Dolichospermum sp. ST_sed9]|nr:DUF2075 domain-containing protein [Dolichospermum sp. ST_sed9]
MTINIVTLGGSGAGKSIYLATLYNKLFAGNPSIDFYFNCSIKKNNNEENEVQAKDREIELFKICSSLINDDEFPEGTRGFEQWEFEVTIQKQLATYTAGSFAFIDYAGGVVNEIALGTEEQKEKLINAIKEANVILVLLDGIQVIDLLRNKSELRTLRTWITEDINLMIADVIKSKTNTPVHFIITKWDCLVHQNLDNLVRIKEALSTINSFKNFIDSSKRIGRAIRLIPVSSLGNDFAIPIYNQEEIFQGMKKISNHLEIKPDLVEVPLAYALIDFLLYKYSEEEKRYEDMDTFSKIIKDFVNIFAQTASFLPPPYNVLTKIAVKVIMQVTNDVGGNTGLFEDIDVKNVNSDTQALKLLINSCVGIIKSFQDSYPGTLLTAQKLK